MSIAAYRRAISEAAMRQAIVEAVGTRGKVFWVHDSRYAPAMADCPDLLILLPPRVLLVELKSQRRRITDGQRAVLDLLADCTRAEAMIVRPEPRDETETSYDAFLEWLR